MAIVEGQKVKVRWHHSNKDWFINKGYEFTKLNEELMVLSNELLDNSKVEIPVICDFCNKKYRLKNSIAVSRNNHFCNRECYNSHRKEFGSPTNTRVKLNCHNCDKEIEVKKYRYEALLNGEQQFITCSRQCQNEVIGRNNSGKNHVNYKGNVRLTCETCLNEFEVAQNRKNRAKYCSVKCQRIGVGKQNVPTKIKTVTCNKCGKEVERWEHQINAYKYHFCSANCRKAFQGIFVSQQKSKIEDTTCQKELNKLLDKMNIAYENEKPYDYYAVDNYLTDHNLIIEVMGDYWHSNPEIYDEYKQLNEMQRKRVKTDKSKRTFIKRKYGIDILYLWEKDIMNNIEICKELIEYYVDNNGKIEDCNSFNYSIIERKLYMDEMVITPYFMRANTSRQVSN